MQRLWNRNTLLLSLTFTLSLALSACGEAYRQPEALPNESASEVDPGNSSEEVEDEEIIPPAPNTVANLGSPTTDPDFTTLPDGRKLSSIKVSGSSLSLAKGSGNTFTVSKKAAYETLKANTLRDANHKVQWTFMDLDSHRVIEKSAGSNKKIFGASSSKIYVGATLLDRKNGVISSSQLQLMADMLVVSSNVAWTNLQTQIGDGSSDKGRERNYDFTQRMGYTQTRGFQGYWGSLHGNELVPDEAAETLYDIYTNAFPGAETLWKMMYTCRTGASRGRKYIPSHIYVGGKTGTYDGATENPATGADYNVRIRNHIMTFNIEGRQYALIIFANDGSDESVALLAGGLIREHTSLK